MPVYSCGDGKYRIGDGPCQYTSRENAIRAYVAYLAQNGDGAENKADKNKISFDFDDTLEKSSIQSIAKRYIAEGKTVYVVTRRQESDSKGVYAITDEIGISRRRVIFTNGKMKWETIKRLGIGKHYDNNPDEIKLIRENTDAEAVQVGSKNTDMIYGYKFVGQGVKDVDAKKGIISGYFSAFNIKDSDGDIIRPGAFKRSIDEWFPKGRIKHLMNHDPSKPLGVLQVLKEDEYGLYYESKIGTHNLGQDFLKMVESDLVKEHSIGFSVIREQKGQDGNEMFDLKLYEGSSLTAWGANEYTPLLGMKSTKEIKDRIKTFEKFVRNTNATDDAIEMCLLEIKQLYQIVETMSSKAAADDAQPEQKSNDDELINAINLLSLKHF